MFRSPLTDTLLVLVVLLLIVGPKKLPQIGRGLGDGMREFKDGITGRGKPDGDDPDRASLTSANAMPPAAAEDDRSTQTAAAPRREAGSEPRA